MEGKIAIVTGANSGIGYEAARALVKKGAQVIMACRNLDKGEVARQKILSEKPEGVVELMRLDLADLASVRQFAEGFLGRYDQLHLLVNNAGVMQIPELQKTADDFEMQFGTNHLGHFALTGLLIDTIDNTPGARVVTVSSFAHHLGRMDFDNLNAEKKYRPARAYGESKLANLLFTYELQRRLEVAGRDTIATAAHPGWTATNLQQHSSMLQFFNNIIAMDAEMGALPTLYAATAPDVEGGDYFGPGGLAEVRGYPKRVSSNGRSHDPDLAQELWAMSEQLTGVKFSIS
jgi:NAD(P)-dependent dehydrogenase (short-subunit alcohol dehydrogenase family)